MARLRMERDRWVADVAATKQDARELGSLDPNIHINDNAAAVMARLDAATAAAQALGVQQETLARRSVSSSSSVAAAETRLAAAEVATELATEQVHLAQTRLNEARNDAAGDATRLAAAEANLAAWTERLDHATDAAARSELELAAAQNAQAASSVRANEANKTAASRVGMIAAAVGLLLPLVAPVAAATIGLGGAFLGMGAAGVLALIGIKREMAAGTAAGATYRSGLDTLKGSLGQLASTSAVAMLASFQRVVMETQAAMPMLNKQVSQFSGMLGRSGANLLTGTINSLRVLNPLFLTAGVYLEQLTAGFAAWTQSGGLEQFGGYALSMLPTVTDLLGKLASTVMHILEALAPLGTIGMAVLSGVADVISAIPVEVLSALIVTVTWGAIAFKAWGFIAPMLAAIAEGMAYATGSMTLLNAAITIGTGPIGWVVAGLAALAGVFAVIIASNTGATQAMQDYTAAVQSDSGAIGENIRQKAAQKLADAGALDAAKKLGISGQTVLAATLGNVAAQKELNDTLSKQQGPDGARKAADRLGISLLDLGQSTATLQTAVQDNGAAISGEVARYATLQDALKTTTGATRAQQSADEAAAAALGISVGALQAASGSQADMKAKTEKATAEMYAQNDAAGLLKGTLDLLNGKTLDNAEAQNRFDSSLANMGAHIDKTGKDVKRATSELEGMTSAAVANRGELISSVQAAQQSAQAFRDNGGSAADAKQKLVDMRQAIIDHAVSVGEDRDQVTKFVDSIYKIPASVPMTKVEVDTANANAALDRLKANMATVARNIQIAVTAHGAGNLATTGGLNIAFAGGGTIPGRANGGPGGTVTGPGTAGSDTAGLFRLAHGEEVISNVFGQADRFRAQLKQINAGAIPTAPMAGYTPTQPTSSRNAAPTHAETTRTVVNNINVTGTNTENPAILAEIVGRVVKQRTAGVRL